MKYPLISLPFDSVKSFLPMNFTLHTGQIYLTNLPPSANEFSLKGLLDPYGKFFIINLRKDFVHIELDLLSNVDVLYSELNGLIWDGYKIGVRKLSIDTGNNWCPSLLSDETILIESIITEFFSAQTKKRGFAYTLDRFADDVSISTSILNEKMDSNLLFIGNCNLESKIPCLTRPVVDPTTCSYQIGRTTKQDKQDSLCASVLPSGKENETPTVLKPTKFVLKSDSTELNLEQIESLRSKRTTIMIRNIPNKYTPQMLSEFINETHQGTYDFLYLRMDFKNKCNVGYAFINFTTSQAIVSFMQRVIGKKWPRFKSDKVIALSFATIQGRQNLIKKFQNSSVMLEHHDWQPQLFYTSGENKGKREPFPKPSNGIYRAKTDVLFSRK
ncbi:RNA recognition motif 2-domain-containing protein [Globomyces pollinis-pini]|nr:RNA recognition motif 2-domain-containing protein [Globomyces pollinis-pini]